MDNEVKLIKYEAAKRAIAEALRVDEVLQIKNAAMAWAVYAKQAKDTKMEEDAIEIRLRAERRLGQIMEEQKEQFGLASAGRPQLATVATVPLPKREEIGFLDNPINSITPCAPTLAEAGIDKNLAHRARSFAKLSDEDFEDRVQTARKSVRRIKNLAALPKDPALELTTEVRHALEKMKKLKELRLEDSTAEAVCHGLTSIISLAQEQLQKFRRNQPLLAEISNVEKIH